MPTPLTHAFIPLALGHTLTDRKLPLRFWFLAVFCLVLPDLDLIGFSLGVSYGDFLGHRGFSHSLFFAFLLSSTVMLLAFRKPPVFSKKWWLIWLFFFGVSSSHGILDAFTNGGLGIALLSPFNTTRYFFPWRPLVLAPMAIRALFTPLGREMLLSELYWIWLPLILALIIAKAFRKIKRRNHNKTRKAECQSVELAKNVFKRLFVVLLIILLIAGIFFQAPWKVLALLAIFLAALTVLPKPARKWFWLSAAAVLIALIIWVFLPDDNEGWRPYTFDEELAALNDKYAIPDSENAAIIYNELLLDDKKYQEPPEDEIIAELKEKGEISVPLHDVNEWLANRSYSTFFPEFWNEDLEDLTLYEFWSSKEHPRVAEWLQQHKVTIAKLIEASKLEKCLFPIPSDTFSLGESMERLAPMRRWAKLLIRATNNDLGDGRINQAIEKNLAVLQIAKHQYQQPTTLDLLVAMGIEAFATKQFNKFVVTGNATEEHLSVIEKALAEIKHDWGYDSPRILECEKLMMKNMLCSMFYQVNPKGKTRLSRDPTALLRAQYPQAAPPPTYWQRKLTKAGTILGWFFGPATPQKAAKIIDTAFKPIYKMADPDFDWQKGPKKFSLTSIKFNFRCIFDMLVSILEPAYHEVHDQYLRAIAEQRGSRIIIALRRYKNKTAHWPEKLDDIKAIAPAEIFVDPINGNSFVYKLTDDGFNLYSKGKNNIDEGGRPDRESGADDWLIWPPRGRKPKAKEENANDE